MLLQQRAWTVRRLAIDNIHDERREEGHRGLGGGLLGGGLPGMGNFP